MNREENMRAELRFPTGAVLPRQEVEARFIRLNHRLVSDPAYHFSVAVTRDWKMVDLGASPPTSDTPVRLIARMQRVNGPDAELNLIAALLPREVHPADWLELWLAGQEHRIVQGRRVPSRFGEVADFLSVPRVDGSVVSRTLATKDGNRLFALSAETAFEDYDALAEELALAVQSFQLLNPSGEYFAEEMEIHTFGQPVRGSVPFPVSWTRTDDAEPPPGGTSFMLVNRRGEEAVGHITFAAVPHHLEERAVGLLQNYASQLERNGVSLERLALSPDAGGPDEIGRSWSAVLPGLRSGRSVEVRCRVVERPRVWILLALAGPARGDDPEAYMVNRRAFEVAADYLELPS